MQSSSLTILPEKNRQAILSNFPDSGAQWIAAYPSFIQSLLAKWQLSVTGMASGGWPTNLVYFVEDASGQSRVLKVGHPSPESLTEGIVLAGNQSHHLVRLIKQDEAGYALLLERVMPGQSLRDSISDVDAITSALELHQLLPRVAQVEDFERLPLFSTWLGKAFSEYRHSSQTDGEFLDHIVRVETIFSAMNDAQQYVLHGDLHHENILKNGDSWMAIDPKGVIGPKAMECGRFLHNFMPDEIEGELTANSFGKLLRERIQLASRVLGQSEKSLAEITYIDLTLAVTWTLNSNQDARDAFLMLRALRHISSEKYS